MNEYQCKELTEKTGAQFSPDGSPNLPPEVEARWLDYIGAFERQFDDAALISLREFGGSLSTRTLAGIPPAELDAEFTQLLDRLAEHDIIVDFFHEVETNEAYRFIVEELLNEEFDIVRIPGMQQHLIYEEFHPNDQEDAHL